MYQGITPAICDRAWNITFGSISGAALTGTIDKVAGTIVVLDPLNGEVLYTSQIDPSHEKAEKYDQIAKAKAEVSLLTGLSSRRVQQDAPHLYQPGMTKWGGSVVENNLVVAFSGVEAVFDEAIAGTMLRWIVALCQHEMTRPGGVMESADSYIPLPEPAQSPTGGWPSLDDL